MSSLPATCIDARQAKKGLDMARNKTDANDADGLAHLSAMNDTKADTLGDRCRMADQSDVEGADFVQTIL